MSFDPTVEKQGKISRAINNEDLQGSDEVPLTKAAKELNRSFD